MICNFQSLVKIPAGFNASLAAELVEATRRELKIKKDWEVTVMVVSPAYIKKLNHKYRHKDKVTDVLSFSQVEGAKMIVAGSKLDYLGDIVLCLNQIKKQAKIFKHSLKREFSLLVIHGLLHLLGYDDKTQKQYEIMAKIQDNVLTKIYGKSIKINKKL